jgi:dolichyl-phosphate beta-glucosyltransferase
VLGQVRDFLRASGAPFEVIVVDDGSTDATADLIREFCAANAAFRLVPTHHGGKAHALLQGLRIATGRIVLFADMDQAIPISELSKLLPWFDQGFDIVVGSRGLERPEAPISRRLISLGQLGARYLVLGFSDIVDTQCGFKAFRRDVIAPLIDRLIVYRAARDRRAAGPSLSPGFDVELLFAAKAMGLRIREVPVQCNHRRGRQAALVRECVRGVSELFAIRRASRKGRYR